MRSPSSRTGRVVASMAALSMCLVLGASCGGAGGGDPRDEAGNGRLWITNAATRAPGFFTCDGTLPNTLRLIGVVCRHSYLDFDEHGNLVSAEGPPIEFTFPALDPAGQVLAGKLWAEYFGRGYEIEGQWSDGTVGGSMCIAGEFQYLTVEILPNRDLHVTLMPP